MLGQEFTRTLRDAQAGNEDAFVRLWRDANPLMIRYLRVVGHDDPYDAACEGWVTVIRGLPGFTGDEVAWHVWLLACTRLRAEEGNLRQAWDAVTVLPGLHVDDDLDIDDLLEPEGSGDPARRGINDTLTALRDLPLGQGEVLMLRLGAGLPASAVADVIGVDVANIQRAETRGLERLETDAGLLSWSLAAPASFSEYADEAVALGAFRLIPTRSRHPKRVRVLAIGAATGRAALAAGSVSSKTMARSRSAVLAVTALSVSAASLGGLSAAAYVGVLPQPVQQALHEAIGAPAPVPASTAADTPSAQATRAARLLTPSSTSQAVDLCRSWAADRTSGVVGDHSAAFRTLAAAAGSSGAVDTYCALVLPVPGATTTVVVPAVPTPRPTTTSGVPGPTSATTSATTDVPTESPSVPSTPPPTATDTPSDTPSTPTETTTAPDPGAGTDPGEGTGAGEGTDPGEATGPGAGTGSDTSADAPARSAGSGPADAPAGADDAPAAGTTTADTSAVDRATETSAAGTQLPRHQQPTPPAPPP